VTSEDFASSEDEAAGAVPRPGKSDAAFRTISEVADDLDVPQHVLRFWETKFSQVKPLKRGGGRRYYRPEDVVLLKRIRALLYTDGMTIRGVQKLLRETGAKALAGEAPDSAASSQNRGDMAAVLGELSALRDELRAALR
jgi:DNA-binding transcriptional MerR regulator